MSTDPRAGVVLTTASELEATARQLHGKDYRLLTDAEASAVWDAIEGRNGNADGD